MSGPLDEIETYIRHRADPRICDGFDCNVDEPKRLLKYVAQLRAMLATLDALP